MFPRILCVAMPALLLAAPFSLAQQKTANTQLGKPEPQPLPDQSKLDGYLGNWENVTKGLRTLDITVNRKRKSAGLGDLDVYTGSIKFMKFEDKNNPVVLAAMDLQKKGGRATDFEKIVFTGAYLYVFQPREKLILYYDAGPAKAGKANDDTFMPFLSGMKAADAKKRYDIKLTKVDADYIYLEIYPRLARDKTDFIRAQIVINRSNFLPARVWYVEANHDTTTFEVVKIEKDKRINRQEFEKPELPGKDWKYKKGEMGEDAPPRIARPQK
ncbi:MAG: TIGR03009 domain-containing protein [Gemmataceae bacterium]